MMPVAHARGARHLDGPPAPGLIEIFASLGQVRSALPVLCTAAAPVIEDTIQNAHAHCTPWCGMQIVVSGSESWVQSLLHTDTTVQWMVQWLMAHGIATSTLS